MFVGPPFSIRKARIELSSSYVAAISRVLYDIAHEIDRTLNAPNRTLDGTTPGIRVSSKEDDVANLPIRIIFQKDAAPTEPAITVTPVPFQFNRSVKAWSQAAVLNWERWDEAETVGSFGFDFEPESLLPGFLYKALVARGAGEQHKGFTHIIGYADPDAVGDPSASLQWELYTDSSGDGVRKLREKQMLPREWERLDPEIVQKKVWDELADIYLNVLDEIDPRCQRFFLITPIHDIRPYGRAFGSPIGCLLLNVGLTRYARHIEQPMATLQMWQEYVEACRQVGSRIVPRLNRSSELLAAEIYKSAMVQVNQDTTLASTDLLRHYAATLRHVQFWERVHVYQHGAYLFSFGWQSVAESSRSNWVEQEVPEAERIDLARVYFAPFGRPYDIECTSIGEPLDPLKDCGLDLDRNELPSLAGAQLIFEFPRSAVLPLASNPYHRAFCRELQHQQLEVLRAVLPLRRARRNALRTAVSAIMGRNMSHNIGSHVLARYSSKARMDTAPVGDDEADHRGDLHSYLQRRMDFIAEVATADKPFGSQVLSLREVVERLNYGRQALRFRRLALEKGGALKKPCKIDAGCLHHLSFRSPVEGPVDEEPRDPILLSYVTGKDAVMASVEYGFPQTHCDVPYETCGVDCNKGYKASRQMPEYLFSCPGGEVGAHALYVILENILRNSARHGGEVSGEVRLFVSVSDEDNPDFLRMEIIDPHTRLRPNGCLSPNKDAEWALQKEKLNGSTSLFTGLKRQKLCSLPAEINSILDAEQLLEESGAPNPDYWGVREMQICAHLLRGGALSEVEGNDARKVALQADVHNLGNGWCLKYTFQLQRAKMLAAVVVDASPWASSLQELRRRGLTVVQMASHPPARDAQIQWQRIAAVVGRHAFLLVENGIDLPGNELTASLPVRTWHADKDMIGQVLAQALAGEPDWTESLHARTLQVYQARRETWKSRTVYGLALTRGGIRRDILPIHPRSGGIFVSGAIRRHGNEETPPSAPLPPHLDTWRKEALLDDGMAAVWVDHCGEDDFNSGARLGSAAVPREMQPPDSPLWICAEGAFSDSAHTEFLNSMGKHSVGNELLASALARVLVLDERVQSEAKREARGGLRLSKLWPMSGIWVPPRTPGESDDTAACDLNFPNLAAIRAFLECPTQCKDQWPVDFLVVHLTILEKLGDSLPDVLQKLKEGTCAQSAEVVIVTGRGVPAIARRTDQRSLRGVRFLPLSAVLESLVVRPSKLGLMRALWSAGRPPHGSH